MTTYEATHHALDAEEAPAVPPPPSFRWGAMPGGIFRPEPGDHYYLGAELTKVLRIGRGWAYVTLGDRSVRVRLGSGRVHPADVRRARTNAITTRE